MTLPSLWASVCNDRVRIAMLAILGGPWVACAWGQALPELWRSALDADPAVSGAQAQVRAAEQRVVQAQAGFGPTIALTATSNSTRYNEAPSYDLRPFSGFQASLQVTQPLLRNALYPALKGAEAQLEQAQALLDQARNESTIRLLEASFETLKARDAVALVAAQRIAADEQLQSARRKFKIGSVSVVDVREAEARIDTVDAQAIAAAADLELRQQVLTELVGRSVPELLSRGLAGDPMPTLALDGLPIWLADAELNSPQIHQARQGVRVAQTEESKAWQGHAPTADLVYSYTRSNDNGTVTSTFPRRGNTSQIGVNVNLPLFASGATQAKVREMVALREKAESELAGARRTVQLAVRQSFTATLSSTGLARGLETATRSLELAFLANRRGYEIGMKVNAEVLEAQSKWFESRRELSRARYDAWLNFLKLRAFTGLLAAADFEQLNANLVPEAAIVPRARSVPRETRP